jgi:hypothetical protein
MWQSQNGVMQSCGKVKMVSYIHGAKSQWCHFAVMAHSRNGVIQSWGTLEWCHAVIWQNEKWCPSVMVHSQNGVMQLWCIVRMVLCSHCAMCIFRMVSCSNAEWSHVAKSEWCIIQSWVYPDGSYSPFSIETE